MPVPNSSDLELVAAFLRRFEGVNQVDIARRVTGVTQDDISRWRRRAFKRLSEKKRQTLIDFLGESAEETPEDAAAAWRAEDDARTPASEDRLLEVFADLANVTRMLTDLGPPGMGEKDKRGILSAIAKLYAHRGIRRPQEWWDLDEALKAGKI